MIEVRPLELRHTVKKVSEFPVSSRDVANQTLPDREKFVADIQAGHGKLANLFLQCN
jgi:hypothetical protein